MKFLLAFALIVAVASAGVARNNFIDPEVQQIGEIIAAIESPSTDPATAQLLEQMLLEILGQDHQDLLVDISPVIIDDVSPVAPNPVVEESSPVKPSPVSVVDGPSPVAPSPVAPAPVAEVPAPAPAAPTQSSSLVQIIVNVNAESAAGVQPVSVNEPAPVNPAPVAEVEQVEQVVPSEVSVVEGAAPVAPPAVVLPDPVSPVVEVEPVDPVSVVELPVAVSPVQVSEPSLPAPEVVSPVQVSEPNLPIGGAAPVVLPEQLN